MLCEQLKKADLARLKVETRALELGFICSRPVIEGTRYDCVIDTSGRLYRAQVKYADGKSTNCSGVVQVNLRKDVVGSGVRGYFDSETDALLVYLPKIDKVCWFGPDVFSGRQSISIRLTPAKNGQLKRCILASDYF